MNDAEMNAALAARARARLAELEKREAELWAALKAIEVEIAPHIARRGRALHEWCSVSADTEALRQMFPEAAQTEAREITGRIDQAMADAPIVERGE